MTIALIVVGALVVAVLVGYAIFGTGGSGPDDIGDPR